MSRVAGPHDCAPRAVLAAGAKRPLTNIDDFASDEWKTQSRVIGRTEGSFDISEVERERCS
jgi:hypothetical protein